MILITKVFNWIVKNFIIVVGILLLLSIGYIKILSNKVVKERNAKVLSQNNFNALSKGTTIWQTRSGNLAAYVQEQKLTIAQLKESTDRKITNLLRVADDMNIKLKKVNTLASSYASIIDNFKTKIIHDTIVNGVMYKEWERYSTPNISITRHFISVDSAAYNYAYHNTLYYLITNSKQGKWKFKNLFVRRPIINTLNITSDDKKYKIDSLVLINKIK